MRRWGKTGWILLLIGFGIFFGIDQAAKQQGEDPAAVHQSYWPRAAGEKANGPEEPSIPANASRLPGEGSSGGSGSAAENRPTTQEPPRSTGTAANGETVPIRAAAAGLSPEKAEWGEPTRLESRSSDSFLNRLGNKLGEAVRGFFSAVVGWIVDLFNRLLG
ncbi:hypothetical protein [Gorillibacterium sp. CAU 1737]|uniref:hypothetical protein n=1 Tax=Gorillibacterium sp. CAU 1737 TaxID=3140362 RepID=UPI00325FDFBA